MSRQRNFLEAIIERKIPVTCRYWSNGRCYNSADRCTYLHGYLCRNDGDCRSPDCSNIHLKQRDSFHSRSRRYSRSRSRSMSPRFRHRRNYKSPPRGKSRNYGPSRSRSRSPRRRIIRSRSRSPRRRFSRSPRRYSRSRTKSPRRGNSRSFSRGRSRSPRQHQSRSPHFEGRSQQEFRQEKSQFPSQSSRFEEVSQDFIKSACAFESAEDIQEVSSPPEVESISLDECIDEPTKVVTLDDIEDGQILTPEESRPECVFLDAESSDEQTCHTDDEVEVLSHSSAPKDASSQLPNKSTRRPRREPSITELTDRIANDFMKPETQALLQNILKLTSDDVSSKASRDGPGSPDPIITEKILDEMAVDLEEVGEEVDDYFGSVAKELHMEESVKVATNPSPPKAPGKLSMVSKRQPDGRMPADYHTDWELKMALENPEKPLEKALDIPLRPPPIEKNRGKKLNNFLWTPALDRRQVVEAKLKMTYQTGKSNWEVETPYIARNTKKETVPIVAASTSGEQNGKPARLELRNPAEKQGRSSENNQKPVISVKKEPSPSEAPPSKVMGDTDTAKDIPRSDKTSLEEIDSLIGEKATLLKEIKVLQSRRSLLQEQKTTMIRGHKGDKKSLDELLEENLFLYEKIGKEMMKRSEKIHKLNVSLVRAMKSSKSQKCGRSKSKSPDVGHKGGQSPDEQSSMKARMMKPKEKDSPEHTQKYRSSKRTYECSRSPERGVSKHDREYSRSPERSKSKHIRDYSRSPERSASKHMQRYSRSPSNRGRDYSRSPERSMKHVREYSRSPERSMKHGREYSRSPERSAYKRSREYSRSPERGFRNRRSPPLSHKIRRSPKNIRSARSPKRTGGRSRSPDSDYNKRSLSPESSRSKQFKFHGPSVAKIQKQHWARSHIMGTLNKFKKDLFAEVDVPFSAKEKPKSQDVNTGPRESSDCTKQPEKESSSKDLRKSRMDDSVEHKLNPQVGDEEPAGQSSVFFGNDSTLALDRVCPPVACQSKMQYRYMDLGMHWCRLCDLVFETLPMYCNHLLSSSHLGKLKNNPKPWLAKATREEKKPLPPDVQMIPIPILGSEFFHSLPVVYCSLCDVFLRDVAEAVKHPECDTHTSNYKTYKENHPSKVESYWKAHQGALFRHKIHSDKKDTKADAKDDVSQQIEGRLLRELKAKRERDGKQKGEKGEDKTTTSVSIKVASREYRPGGAQKPKDDNCGAVLAPREKSQAKLAKEGKSQPKEVHEKVAKESKQQGKENGVQVARAMAKSATVKEKVAEKVVESRETTDKLQSTSQDKHAKESVSGTSIKFPLVGKMPSFRKKASEKKTGIGSSKDPMSLDLKLPDSSDLSDSVESLPVDGGNAHDRKRIGGQDNESNVIPSDGVEESRTDENVIINNPENVNVIQEGITPKGTVTKGNNMLPSMSTTKEPEELLHEMHEAMVSDMELEEEGSTSDQETGKENKVDCDLSYFERTDKGGPNFEKPDSQSDKTEPDVASATVEALQLLNIPLPGFEPSKKPQAPDLVPEAKEDINIQQVLEIPLPPPSATAKNLELDGLTPFSHCAQIEAGMISYGCEVQNEISLPPPMSTSKTLVLEALNPFSHSMQMDAGMIAYGSDVTNVFSLESSCVDAPMPYSNHESLPSFPCHSRECTPPPPGTETAPELPGELPYVDEHENSTPPPPGTEPSLLVESPVQDRSNRRNSSNNIKEKSDGVVESNKSSDHSEKKGKSLAVLQVRALPKSVEIEQRLSEMFAEDCPGKQSIAEVEAHILEGPVVKDLSSSLITGDTETSLEKMSEREGLNIPVSLEDTKTKERTKSSSPANKNKKCSLNIKTRREDELTETSDSLQSHGEASEEMDPKTADKKEQERIKSETRCLRVELHRIVISTSDETDCTSLESSDDLGSKRTLDQVISDEYDTSKDDVSLHSEADVNLDTGPAKEKAAFDEVDPKTGDKDKQESIRSGTKSLCVGLRRVVIAASDETDRTSPESSDDLGSKRTLDQMISDEYDTSKDDVSSHSEADVNLATGPAKKGVAFDEAQDAGPAKKKETFDEEHEENEKDEVVSGDDSRETLVSEEGETVEKEALEVSARPRRTTRSTRSDKMKVKAIAKSPRGKSLSLSSLEHPKPAGSNPCPDLPVESTTPSETPNDSTEDELSLDSLPDLSKLAEIRVPPPEEPMPSPIRRSVRNAINDKGESKPSNETPKGESKASSRKEVLPSRRSSRTAKSSSLAETPKVLETLDEKCEAKGSQGVRSDSQKNEGTQKSPAETSKKKKENPRTPPKRSTRRAAAMDSKAKQQKCLHSSPGSS